MVVCFYFNVDHWIRASVAGCLIFGALIAFTGLLLRKANLTEGEAVSLARPWLLVWCELGWKVLSLGVIAMLPALAWDVVASSSVRKLSESPFLLITLVAHLFLIAVCVSMIHRVARAERRVQGITGDSEIETGVHT
jgi:hypothetical protein